MTHSIRFMLERKVEGVAVMTFGIEQPLREPFAQRKVPLVFIDVGPERPGISLLKVPEPPSPRCAATWKAIRTPSPNARKDQNSLGRARIDGSPQT